MPAGACSLWPLKVTASAASTSTSILPNACAASTSRWIPPRTDFRRPAISPMGWTIPVSLLAAWTQTRTEDDVGAHLTARSASSMSSMPSGRTGRTEPPEAETGFDTDACSTAEQKRAAPGMEAKPLTTMLLPSVPPEVKYRLSGSAPPRASATSMRAFSMTSRARSPAECALEGLCGPPSRTSSSAVRAAVDGAVVAFASR